MQNRFTKKAQAAIDHSLQAAGESGHTYIGSEHLLLGLISVRDSIAGQILDNAGITYDKTKNAICEFAGIGAQTHLTATEMTPSLKAIIKESARESVQNRSNYIFGAWSNYGTFHLPHSRPVYFNVRRKS